MTDEVDASLNFRHDERGVTPEWFYQESKLFKGKSLWIPDY